MIKCSERYEQITNGGDTNGFTVKEILVEHIKHQKKVNQFVVEQFLKGSDKIGMHTTAIYYMKWIIGGMALGLAYLFIYTFIIVPRFLVPL